MSRINLNSYFSSFGVDKLLFFNRFGFNLKNSRKHKVCPRDRSQSIKNFATCSIKIQSSRFLAQDLHDPV